jgi:hypothetical protein
MKQDSPTAALRAWGIMRIQAGSGEGASRAVGLVTRHPKLKVGEIGITSEVLAIADDRSWLKSRNRIYELREEESELSEDMRVQAIWTLNTHYGVLPRQIFWLRRDGAAYSAWSQSEMERLCEDELGIRGKLYARLRRTIGDAKV